MRTELVQLREDSGGEVETRYKVGAKDVQCMVTRRKAGVEEEQRMVGQTSRRKTDEEAVKRMAEEAARHNATMTQRRERGSSRLGSRAVQKRVGGTQKT